MDGTEASQQQWHTPLDVLIQIIDFIEPYAHPK